MAKQKGFALVSVIVVAIVLALGTAAILTALSSFSQLKRVTIEGIKAQYLAEAGVQYAIWELRNGQTGNHTVAGGNALSIEGANNIEIIKTLQPDGVTYKIESEATYTT